MTIEEIRRHLADRNLSIVARAIGMSRQQLWAIKSGRNENPTAKTMRRIARYLQDNRV